MQLVEGYAEHAPADRRADLDLLGRLDAGPDAGRGPQRPAAGGLRADLGGRRPRRGGLDEAVELAKEFSTDESPAFVNGLLGRLQGAQADPAALSTRAGAAEPPPAADRPPGPPHSTAAAVTGPGGRSRAARACSTGARSALTGLSRASAAGGSGLGLVGARLRPPRGHGAAGVRVEHAPADELLGQHRGRLVVDHGQGAQVVLADREHLAVVVAALALDRRRVALQRARPSRPAPGPAAPGPAPASAAARRRRRAWCPAAAPAPARRRSRRARRGAARSRRGRRARTSRRRPPSSGPGTSPRRRGGRGPAGCGWRGASLRAAWRIRWTYGSPGRKLGDSL